MQGLESLPEVAQALGEALPHGGVVAIHGAMGAGKTTLVRAAPRSLGAPKRKRGRAPRLGWCITTLSHRVDRAKVRHMDLYRLENEEEAERSGIAEMLTDGPLNLVEWPERIPGLMPDDAWLIEMKVEADDSRTCILSQLRG